MAKRGRYRTRITLLRPVDDVDDFNNPQPRDTAIGRRWASVEPMTGREFAQNSQVHGEITHLVRMHSDDMTRGLQPSDKIQAEGRTLEIVYAFDINFRRQEVECQCKEATA